MPFLTVDYTLHFKENWKKKKLTKIKTKKRNIFFKKIVKKEVRKLGFLALTLTPTLNYLTSEEQLPVTLNSSVLRPTEFNSVLINDVDPYINKSNVAERSIFVITVVKMLLLEKLHYFHVKTY